MEKFTVAQYKEAKEAAKGFGINFVGKKKEVLVELVNKEIDKLNKLNKKEQPKKEKWYTNGYGFQPGDVVVIEKKNVLEGGVPKEILHNRHARIVKPSEVEGMVKAILINNKNGQEQNCEISLEIKFINKLEKQLMVI